MWIYLAVIAQRLTSAHYGSPHLLRLYALALLGRLGFLIGYASDVQHTTSGLRQQ